MVNYGMKGYFFFMYWHFYAVCILIPYDVFFMYFSFLYGFSKLVLVI